MPVTLEQMYQFLILGNVEIPYGNAKVMNWDDGYQFLILGNVALWDKSKECWTEVVSIPNIR